MKKVLLTCSLILTALAGYTQQPGFHELFTKGKEEYLLQIAKDTPRFENACRYFREAVALEPSNAEARYFLAYSLDKLNSSHGGFMDQNKLTLTLQASEQMEKVITLQPQYKGEILVLDPYSKLTSIWGSLAFSYLSRQKPDSALWALQGGQKRGGFINALLAYNQQLLNQCKPNAVLITSGDNATFPMLYLQQIKGIRKDITVIDAALIHAAWYTKYLKRNTNIIISYSEAEMDTLNYQVWAPTPIEIINKNNPAQTLAWTLHPTYYEHYILQGDKVLLDIFKHNYFEKEFYFTGPTDTTFNLFLTDHLKDEGLLYHVVANEDNEALEETLKQNLQQFSIAGLTNEEITQSTDALAILNNLRLTYARRAYTLRELGLHEDAKKLFQEMEKKFPLKKMPIYPAAFEDSYNQVRTFVNE